MNTEARQRIRQIEDQIRAMTRAYRESGEEYERIAELTQIDDLLIEALDLAGYKSLADAYQEFCEA